MAEITPDELNEVLESDEDDPFVLDIRHAEEFREWRIPGSVNVDVYDELREDPESADEALSAVPADAEVVTVCAAGVLSQRATDRLEEMGYDAKTLEDGMAGWSRVHRTAAVDVDLDGTLVQVARPGKGCLSHVLVSDGEAAVFDPSQYTEEYEAVLDEHDAELVGVFDTHAHADHVSGGQKIPEQRDATGGSVSERRAASAGSHERRDATYHLHPEDAEAVDAEPVRDGETFEVGRVEVEVIHTPGHSPGGVTYAIEDEALLTGDTLFHESVGRVELGVEAGLEETDVEANAATLYESLRRLRDRDGDPLVLPAHDPGSPDPPVAARLSEVRERNPDLGRSREEFVAALSSDVPDHPPNFERVKLVNVGADDLPDDELAALEVGPNRCAAD